MPNAYQKMTAPELDAAIADLEAQAADLRALNLKLDMARGKPSPEQTALSKPMLDLVTSGIAEVGIVRTPFSTQGLRTRYAPAEPLVAVMPPTFERGDELSVLLAQLEDVPIICDSRTADTLDRAPFCITDDTRSACSCAAAGLGVGLVPRSLLTVCDTGPCYIKTLTEKDLESRAAVIWKADRALSPLAERAVALLGELT